MVAAARDLLGTARHDLANAMGTTVATERYAAAHLAALRTAAAVLAVRTRPSGHQAAAQRVVVLPQVAPELAEWAAFFAAGASKRAAAEAGLSRAVTPREADDLLRDAQTFLALVETTLGLRPPAGDPAPRGAGLPRQLATPAPVRHPSTATPGSERPRMPPVTATPSSTCTSPPATRCATAPPTRTSWSSAPPSTAWTPWR